MAGLAEDLPVGDTPVVDKPSCRLLGPTALIVQALMGVLVISSLVYKRHRESPKRPWRIWVFDIAKQVVGQMFVHGTNVLLSDVLSRVSSGNACIFYFLNILVDTTLGVGVIYVTLHALTTLLTERLGFAGFETGQYGDPPSFKFWARQASVYVLSITTMKMLVVALFALWPGIFQIGQWLLSWTGDGTNFQIIFTMGLFPIIMNILQFWLIDTIVKGADYKAGVSLGSDSARASATLDREPLFRADGADGADSDDDEGMDSRRPHDIENPPFRAKSPPAPIGKNGEAAEENKGNGAEPSVAGSGSSNSFAMHAYPPLDRATSPTSMRSNKSTPKRRRSPPAQLAPRSPMQPAINSPIPALGDTGRAYQPNAPAVARPSNVAGTHDANEWDVSWDNEDWADRVGEEDWTGRRVDAAKGFVENAWDSSNASAGIRVG